MRLIFFWSAFLGALLWETDSIITQTYTHTYGEDAKFNPEPYIEMMCFFFLGVFLLDAPEVNKTTATPECTITQITKMHRSSRNGYRNRLSVE